jgi:hypothetical protein
VNTFTLLGIAVGLATNVWALSYACRSATIS